jgi:hypothetical protein
VGNQIVSLGIRAEDFAAFCVDDEDFGGLGAAVDAKEKCSHNFGRRE